MPSHVDTGAAEVGYTLLHEIITVSLNTLADRSDRTSDLHDFFMIIYLLLTLPWMFLSMQNSTTARCRRRR